MTSKLEYHIQKHPQVSATLLEGELVVMGPEDNIYYRINTTGMRIWTFLESKTCSVQAIVAYVAASYGLPQNEVLRDVETFILVMLEKGFFQAKENLARG